MKIPIEKTNCAHMDGFNSGRNSAQDDVNEDMLVGMPNCNGWFQKSKEMSLDEQKAQEDDANAISAEKELEDDANAISTEQEQEDDAKGIAEPVTVPLPKTPKVLKGIMQEISNIIIKNTIIPAPLKSVSIPADNQCLSQTFGRNSQSDINPNQFTSSQTNTSQRQQLEECEKVSPV